jgi:antitoxin ParD1/3/4
VTVVLSGEAQRFVEEKVRAGQYDSAEQAVNALIGLAQEQERLTPDDIAELRDEIDVGLHEAERGDFVQFTAEDIIAEGHKALSARRKKA